MMKTILLSMTMLCSTAHHAAGGSGIERVTLMLTGPGCEALHAQLETTVGRLDGVRALDYHSVPGHVLIDIDSGRMTAAQLVQRVNEIATNPPCRAGVMESCITAGSIASK